MSTEVNEGRGFPLAEDGEAPIVVAPHRQLLFRLVEQALYAEGGYLRQRAASKKTDYYSGRVAGFIASAAHLMAVLYGGEYDAGKLALSQGVRAAGEGLPIEDLQTRDTVVALAVTIAERALEKI